MTKTTSVLCLVSLMWLPAQVLAQSAYMAGACRIAAEEFWPHSPPQAITPHPGPIPPPPVCRIDHGCLQVDWNIAPMMDIEETLKLFRFDEKHPLRIHTTNVNRLRYKVKWTQVVQERPAAFERVTGLLDSVAPILSLIPGAGGFALSGQDQTFVSWLRGIEYSSACLTEISGRLTDVVLDRQGTENRQRLFEAHYVLSRAIPELLERRKAYLDTEPQLETYTKLAQRHDDVVKRVTEFLPLARNSVEGETTVLSQEKRNSVVVLTGQATTSAAETVGQAVTARYFVAWSRPVLYHAGYGYGRLKEFDFKQVRTLAGQDLFSATKPVDAAAAGDLSDDAGSAEAVAFLTWELLRAGPNERFGLGATVGAGLQAPGDSIYIGGTFRVFSRLLVTIGGVAATASRGQGVVIDTTTSPDSTRTLFSELRERTDWNPFWSVSFKVY